MKKFEEAKHSLKYEKMDKLHMEFLEIINKLSSKIETYLFKTFDIAIQKNEDKSYLSFGKGAVNNTNYLKELKVI